MYMIENMIEMGLEEGQEFPNNAYRVVACNLALFNKNVTTRDALTTIVQEVLLIPEDKIRTITFYELSDNIKYYF